MLPREVVEFTRVHHEGEQITFVFLKGFVDQPHRFKKWHVHVGGTVQNKKRPRKTIDV